MSKLSLEDAVIEQRAPVGVVRAKPTKAEMSRRIATAIADNRLPPEAKLGEESLARFFGVSRARIREVLNDLALQRLITLLPNRGAFVAAPSVEETRQICEARRVIETATTHMAACRARPGGTKQLRSLIDAEQKAWHDGQHHDAVRHSREFHLALARLGGNEVLVETLANVLSRSSLASALYGERRNPGCLCQDHFAILDAIEARDPSRAAELMTAHLTQVERRMRLDDDSTTEVSIEDALSHTQ